MTKKLILGLAAVAVVVGGVAAMSAFEAHIINVTAKIENALSVPMPEINFGTVFPEEEFEESFNVVLSESFQEQAECSNVNLVGNGSFEYPSVTDSAQWDIFGSETPGLVWTIEWRSDIPTEYGDYDRPSPALKELHAGVNGWNPYEGNQYAELDTDWFGPGHPLNNEPASVHIYQDIPTTPGRKYQLSFAFSPRPSTPGSDNEMDVMWDGSVVATIGPEAGDGNTNWTVYEYTVVASDSSSKLEFVDRGTANSLGTFLDDVTLVECGRVTDVYYVLRQKPKCVDLSDPSVHPLVQHDGETFFCPEGSEMMPLLCPYLSKHDNDPEDQNDDLLVEAFHGPLTGWSMADTLQYQLNGELSVTDGDLEDAWLIDLKVPCFEGYCAQDNWIPEDYQADPQYESKVFGCDLWLEVIGINGVEK